MINTPVRFKQPKIELVSLGAGNYFYRFSKPYKFVYRGIIYDFKVGFEFDLASSPKLLWWLFSLHDGGVLATAIHDLICKKRGLLSKDSTTSCMYVEDTNMTRRGLLRMGSKEGHKVFHEIMLIDKISKYKAWIGYQGVDKFGSDWSEESSKLT